MDGGLSDFGPDLARREPTVDRNPRCRHCGRKLAEYVGRPWRIKCGRCGAWTWAELEHPAATR